MATVNLRLTLDAETPIEDYLADGTISEAFPCADCWQVIIKDVDEVLIESMNPDDLVEFFGIDSEFLIATEVLEFA